jgi:hypothetical protein
VSKENLGTFCTKHHRRQREAGHAWHPIPKGKQRTAARQAVVRYLDEISKGKDAASFLALMDRAVSRLREPVSNALTPPQIRRQAPALTTKGKSQIVFAWLFTSIVSDKINDHAGANFVSSEDFADNGVQVIDGKTGDRKSVYTRLTSTLRTSSGWKASQ